MHTSKNNSTFATEFNVLCMEAYKKLTKSRNKSIAGVCGGIAEYFGIDPTVVRIGYFLLTLLCAAFPGILIYIILTLVMPDSE